MAPSFREAYGRPVASVTGSASMSPRSSTVSPGLAPRSTAVTELSACPVVISSGSPSSAASTFSWVLGRSSPISGSAWMARRSSASSPEIAAASSLTQPMTVLSSARGRHAAWSSVPWPADAGQAPDCLDSGRHSDRRLRPMR